MRRILTVLSALLLALVVLPALAADDKDKDKKDPAPDAKKDAAPDAKKDADKDTKEPPVEKPIKVGTVNGKLVEVNETAKSIKVEITTEYSKPNVGEIQAMRNCEIQLAQTRDYGTILSLRQQMIQHQLHSTTIEKKTSTVEYTSTDDVKVRLMEPPPAFDDKGNIKKRTKKELDELKGDPKDPDFKLPGYPAAFTDLHQGGMVVATLVKKKGVPHHTGPKPKDADPDLAQDNLPMISMIEILPDPPGTK
jgi:hypothetical protein